MRRFLDRLWRLVGGLEPGGAGRRGPRCDALEDDPVALELVRKAEATVAKVTADIGERFSFHTAISSDPGAGQPRHEGRVRGHDRRPTRAREALRYAAQTAVSLLFPFAPHVRQRDVGGARRRDAVARAVARAADPAFLERDTVTVVVQVNGKLRERAGGAGGAGPGASWSRGPATCRGWRRRSTGREVVREVVVPDRLVNLVLG